MIYNIYVKYFNWEILQGNFIYYIAKIFVACYNKYVRILALYKEDRYV